MARAEIRVLRKYLEQVGRAVVKGLEESRRVKAK